MIRRNILALILLFIIQPALAQSSGKLLIQNFNGKDYHTSAANFSVTHDNRGITYVANYDGVLQYDGKYWKVIPLPENSIAVSLATDDRNRVFVGTQNDFGYLKPDSTGKLHFESLKSRMTANCTVGFIWNITCFQNLVYFSSLNQIFVLKDEKISCIETSDKRMSPVFSVNDSLYSFLSSKELFTLQDDSLIYNRKIDGLSSDRLKTILPFTGNEWLLGSQKHLYRLSKSTVIELKNQSSEFVNQHNLQVGISHQHNNNLYFIFGSQQGGLLVVDDSLSVVSEVNSLRGLQSESIKALSIDHHNGLWAAMQEGVSRLEIFSPWEYWDEKTGLKGTPSEVIKFNQRIYVGTTRGLYYMENGKFSPIKEVSSLVWSLCEFNNELYAGTGDGIYVIGENIRKIDSRAVTSIFYSKNNNALIIGHMNGIDIIKNNKGTGELTEILEASSTFNQITEDSAGNVWASSKFKGLYKLSELATDTPVVKFFNKSDGLPDVNKLNVIIHENNVFVTTQKGLYKYIDSSNSSHFVYDTSLLKTPLYIEAITKDEKENYYASVVITNQNEHIEKLTKDSKGQLKREIIPFRRLPEMQIFSVFAEDNGNIWITGSEGLYKYDPSVQKDYTVPFHTLIRKALVSDSIIFHGSYSSTTTGTEIPGLGISQPDYLIPHLSFDNNNITFEYAATSYEMPQKNQYAYYLENNDNDWSNWSNETKKEYTNLAPGKYTFHVKSKNIYDIEGQVASYQFTILPPWYRTAWAYGIFTILAACLVWLISMAYSLRVRIQRKKLRLIVADRTYEVMSQKKEIEKQNNLLKAKNEEIILQKDDIEVKNKQLNESQEEILSMNQKLTELNMYLEKKVEKRTSKIKDTVKQLQQINMELDTFVYRASHDLKGPISRINGITSLAKLESPDTINLKYFNLIEDTAKEMGVLLSKLAQVHEIINAEVHKEEIDIPSLLSEIREDVKFLDKGHQTKYSFDLEAIMLWSDRHLLSIIIKNLIENALIFRKTSEKDAHHIQVSTSSTSKSFCIKIRDNGIGIHPDHTSKIFLMFFRGSDKSKGSGLGLYLVKMAIDKLCATILLESKEGAFTEFNIEIPTQHHFDAEEESLMFNQLKE